MSGSALAVIVVAAGLNVFVFQSYYVDGESMSPNLHDDDRLIVSKLERTVSSIVTGDYLPERGQIVIVNGAISPETQANAPQLIKRVIGLPGDTVTIAGGTVTIRNQDSPNGFDVDEALELDVDPTYTAQPLSVTVPKDSVFVLGDNRAEGGSYDSRSFGTVDSDFVVGRLWAKIMPFDQSRVF